MADENKKKNGDEKKNEEAPAPQDNLVTTKHTVVIGGREIKYSVTTGTMVLKEEAEKEGKAEGEKAKAAVFFVAYTLDTEEDADSAAHRRTRPLTFSFNGGPGSSSVWLHLGVLGPRRVLMGEDGEQLPPPFRLVDNEYSLLDMTDLVFIDPVSTGYSRAVKGEKAREFHNFKKDIASVGDFIRLYTSRYQRWTSPKFLIGESYGTTRAAGLSGYLQGRHGMYLNGLMLVSSILDFQTARFVPGNDFPYIMFLPTYAATAWYHKRVAQEYLDQPVMEFLEAVEEFAAGEYTLALMKGATLSADARAQAQKKLAAFTGLSEEYIERADLRVNIFRFCKELLRDQRRTVGRLDSRYTGIDRDAAGEYFEFDPSHAAITGTYTATFNDYVRSELEFESDLPYEILAWNQVQPWGYNEHQNTYVNVAETLRQAMTTNTHLKVFVANGYYDLATPYFATEYTFNHLALDAELQGNISMDYYEAGHMMYVHIPSLAKLKGDLAGFIQSAVPD